MALLPPEDELNQKSPKSNGMLDAFGLGKSEEELTDETEGVPDDYQHSQVDSLQKSHERIQPSLNQDRTESRSQNESGASASAKATPQPGTASTQPKSPTENPSQTNQGGLRGSLGRGINNLLQRRDRDGSKTKPEKARDDAKDKLKHEATEKAEAAAKNVGKKVLQQVGKQALAMGARAVAALTSEIWVPILGVLLAVIAIIIFIAIGYSGWGGSSFHQQSDGDTQLKALANAGDPFALKTLVFKNNIPAIKLALATVRTKAQAKNDTEAVKLVDDSLAVIATYSGNDSGVDRKIIQDVGANLDQLSKLGYGSTLTRFSASAANTAISGLMANNRLTFQQPNDREGVPNGFIKRTAKRPGTPDPVPVNPMIPLFLVAIDHDFGPISVSSVVGTHDRLSGSNNQSAHWTGNGMDISTIQGQDVFHHQDLAQTMLQWILDHKSTLEQQGIQINQTIGPAKYASLQIRQGKQVSDGSQGYLRDHENHMHVGFYALGGQ